MDSGRRGKKRPCPKPSTAPAGPSPTREEDEEEEEMEEFYALVGRIREMRDMLKSNAGTRLANAATPLWKPAFKLEDFRHRDEAESSAAALVEPPKEEKRMNEEGKKEAGKEECGLDLSLAL
ncbi:NRR repressor homolog 3-like [Musa acuminata AAA Group]|uniref:NRR repressor homolog 3 n=1 Tax=Musa acuminata AAA Group TaxID=214697 RepID=UPI0031E050D2